MYIIFNRFVKLTRVRFLGISIQKVLGMDMNRLGTFIANKFTKLLYII